MTEHTYTTRDDAIYWQIIRPIEATGEASRDDFDIDAIAAEVLGDYSTGYACTVDEEVFWAAVAAHQL